MGKRTVLYIIILSSLSLLGLIVTQTLWVRNALKLADQQHSHRVDIALDNVLEEMVGKLDSTEVSQSLNITRQEPSDLFEVLDTVFLRELLNKYVDYHKLDQNFSYAIVKTSNDSLIFSSEKISENARHMVTHKACLYCLWKKDYYHLALYFPDIRKHELVKMSAWLISSGIFLLIIILTFYITISLIIKQKKVSQIRDDFINNITHEFKTPIATISLASEVLLNSESQNPESRTSKYARVIYDENRRMRQQVDRVMQMAVLDKHNYSLETKEINMDELIRNNVHNLCLEHCDNNVKVIDNLNSTNPVVKVDPIHLGNIINNLVSNSIKYSADNPLIKIVSRNDNGHYIFSVEDNGIGIRKEDQSQIFDKFFRVHTGNVHNVKGFGIGLYYVKTMVEAHKGRIKVWSEPGKGTRFDVLLPQNQN